MCVWQPWSLGVAMVREAAWGVSQMSLVLQVPRPLAMKKESIQTRKRKPKLPRGKSATGGCTTRSLTMDTDLIWDQPGLSPVFMLVTAALGGCWGMCPRPCWTNMDVQSNVQQVAPYSRDYEPPRWAAAVISSEGGGSSPSHMVGGVSVQVPPPLRRVPRPRGQPQNTPPP